MPAARVVLISLALPLLATSAASQSQFTRPAAPDQQADRNNHFDTLDTNRNGVIERSEWRDSADAFDWLDRDRDGVLTRGEVVGRARQQPGRAVPRLPQTTGTSGARQDCVANPAQVVDDVYQQVLGRPADPASAGMTQALAAGTMTVRQIVAQVAKSPEHAEKIYWRPLAATIYRQMLNRDPDEQELQQMAADLATGRRPMFEVVARTASRAASNEEEAVRILYRRLLGREADPQGLRDFTELARRDGIESVARAIVSSPEYRQRSAAVAGEDAAAHENAVRSLYRHVLGREADPVGIKDLTRVATTGGFDAVVDRMVNSAEYERLYGDDVVPGRSVRFCGPTR